jgi:hypothetical protein
MPDDAGLEERIVLGRLEALIRSHPERLERFLDEVTSLFDRCRPLSTERTLNARQAAERAGCSHVTLLRHCANGTVGARNEDGHPRFSEQECDVFRQTVRKPGRPRTAERSS